MAKRVTADWTVVVDRPVEQVFDYLTDISRHHEWASGEFRIENLTEGPLAVGSTWTSYGFQPPNSKDHRNDVTVTELVRPSRFAFAAADRGDETINSYVLTAEGSGTRVERTMDFPKPGGPMGLAFPGLLKGVIKPGIQKTMEVFKANIEGAGE